jgi:hypothetical protein
VIYILFGNANFGKMGDIQIDQLIASNPSSCLKIISPYLSYAGYSIAGIGDINSDGYNDLAIGSVPINNANYGEQRTYIIYGREISSGVKNDLYLSAMTEKDGFIVRGGGFFVTGVGDVNNDGIADVMITSYYQWKGQGNAYLINYPKYASYSPTFQPSSFPSMLPISEPSVSPSSRQSLDVHSPTNVPSFKETITTNQPTSQDATLPPFLPTRTATTPTAAPKTSKPTRIPSLSPSTCSPSVIPTCPPSLSPSRKPTTQPIKGKTMSPTTRKPSRFPTVHPVVPSASFPSSSPSLTPTVSLSSIPIHEITVDSEGVYKVPDGNGNYIISGEGSFEIRSNSNNNKDGSGGGGKRIYTILPAKNTITITGFNKKYDQIGLLHFPYLNSIYDLIYRTNPLQIVLSSQQQLILSSVDIIELTEDNFLFQKENTENEKKINFAVDLSAVICLGILIGLIVIFGCVTKLNETKVNVEKDNDQELSDELSFDIGSSELSSLDIDSEDDYDSNNLEENSLRFEEVETENEKDWKFFSSLKSFFSSENDEDSLQISTNPEEEEEMEDNIEYEVDYNHDIEGNYYHYDDKNDDNEDYYPEEDNSIQPPSYHYYDDDD